MKKETVSIVLCLLNVGCLVANKILMKTDAGTFIGMPTSVTFDGTTRTVNEFLGIPYAQPPLGRRRFQRPEPASRLTEPYNASEFGPICPQGGMQVIQFSDVRVSENCLTLNIFAPPSSANNLLPVMIFIHGGGYTTGSSKLYVADVLSSYGNVIVVTFNYRLSIFGFLYTADEEAPGNMALWDQRLAIQWVHDNIHGCFGDKNKITLFGQGSGAESVLHQAMYPGNKGLFSRVISESGTPISFRGTQFGRAENHVSYLTISHTVGCISLTSRQFVSCLRNKTTSEIILDLKSSFYQIPFTPVYDGNFIKDDPQIMLDPKNTQFADVQQFFSSIELIIGGNNMDGAVYMFFLWKAMLIIPNMEHFQFNQSKFHQTIIPAILSQIYGRRFPEYVVDAVMTRYSDVTDITSYERRRDLLLRLTTDYSFTVPILHTSRIRETLLPSKTYVYNFAVNSTLTYNKLKPSWINGANHGDETAFVFGFSERMLLALEVGNFRPTEKEVLLSKHIMSLWTNFAKTGLPNFPRTIPGCPVWPKFSVSGGNYLELSTEMTTEGAAQEAYGEPGGSFWLSFLPQILPSSSGGPADTGNMRECPPSGTPQDGSAADTAKVMIPVLGVVLCVFAVANAVVCIYVQKRKQKPQRYDTVEM